MSASSLDPRQRRTRDALKQAILVLAEGGPVSSVSMAALARAAGVHRTTLYQHLRSPDAWLATVLREELDEVRANLFATPASADMAQPMGAVVRGVLDHLEAHATIYSRELSRADSAVVAMLSTHFQETTLQVLTERPPPGLPSTDDPELFAKLASHWISHASVGAMAVWLQQPAPRDPERYLRAHAELLPPWWPRAR